MKFNKLILTGLATVLGSSFVFSGGFDYNIGGGFGYYQTSALQNGILDKTFDIGTSTEFTIDRFSNSDYSWTGGGFLGLGGSFEAGLPMAVGVEYKGEYLNTKRQLFYTINPVGGELISGKEVASLSAYKHSLDVYYKLDLVEGSFPISLQFMAGLAMFNPLSYDRYTEKAGSSSVEIARYYYSGFSMGLGAHLGMRAQFHMFYLGIDYTNLGYYHAGSLKGVTDTDVANIASMNSFSKNTVNFSVGLIFNNAVLKAINS